MIQYSHQTKLLSLLNIINSTNSWLKKPFSYAQYPNVVLRELPFHKSDDGCDGFSSTCSPVLLICLLASLFAYACVFLDVRVHANKMELTHHILATLSHEQNKYFFFLLLLLQQKVSNNSNSVKTFETSQILNFPPYHFRCFSIINFDMFCCWWILFLFAKLEMEYIAKKEIWSKFCWSNYSMTEITFITVTWNVRYSIQCE